MVWTQGPCLKSVLFFSLPTVCSTPKTVKPPDLSMVPQEYHDLDEVFSKEPAISLPLKCPYDCQIDLLPGGPLLTCASFFFVAKKDKSLPALTISAITI